MLDNGSKTEKDRKRTGRVTGMWKDASRKRYQDTSLNKPHASQRVFLGLSVVVRRWAQHCDQQPEECPVSSGSSTLVKLELWLVWRKEFQNKPEWSKCSELINPLDRDSPRIKKVHSWRHECGLEKDLRLGVITYVYVRTGGRVGEGDSVAFKVTLFKEYNWVGLKFKWSLNSGFKIK